MVKIDMVWPLLTALHVRGNSLSEKRTLTRFNSSGKNREEMRGQTKMKQGENYSENEVY